MWNKLSIRDVLLLHQIMSRQSSRIVWSMDFRFGRTSRLIKLQKQLSKVSIILAVFWKETTIGVAIVQRKHNFTQKKVNWGRKKKKNKLESSNTVHRERSESIIVVGLWFERPRKTWCMTMNYQTHSESIFLPNHNSHRIAHRTHVEFRASFSW